MIDLLAWSLVAIATTVPMAIIYIVGMPQDQVDAISSGQQSLLLTQFEMGVAEAVIWMAVAMYEVVGVWLFGCTAGKAITGLRVRSRDPATSGRFPTAALRAVPLVLIAVIVLLELAIVGSIAISRSLTMLVALIGLVLVSLGRSTVWDELAKTEVVSKAAAARPQRRQ